MLLRVLERRNVAETLPLWTLRLKMRQRQVRVGYRKRIVCWDQSRDLDHCITSETCQCSGESMRSYKALAMPPVARIPQRIVLGSGMSSRGEECFESVLFVAVYIVSPKLTSERCPFSTQ